MRIQQKVTLYEKICKWKTGSICHAKGSKVLYLSGDPNAGPLKGWFLLACWIFCNVTKLFKQWLVNMLIILLLTFWYATIQYRKDKLRWIFFVYVFVKTKYFWILLQYVTFQVQVEISIYVMLPTLESFNRPFMRLWFYAMFIQIEFGSSMQSFHWNYTKYLFRHLVFNKISCYKTQAFMWNNEKWKILAWYPNKMRHIANIIQNAAIDTEWNFKYKWP